MPLALQNAAKRLSGMEMFVFTVPSVAVVVITGGVVWVNRTAYRKIDELEKL